MKKIDQSTMPVDSEQNISNGGDDSFIPFLNKKNDKDIEAASPPLDTSPISLSIVNTLDMVTTEKTVANLSELQDLLLREDVAPGVFCGNKIRNKANFVNSELIFLDVEDGTTPEEVKIQLDKLNLQYSILCSRNHMKIKNPGESCEKPAIPRLRVVIPLSRQTLSAQEHESVMHGVQIQFPYNDPKTKDAARFYYKCSSVHSSKLKGKKLNVDEMLSLGVTEQSRAQRTSNKPKERLSRQTTDFIESGAIPGQWNSRLFKAAKDFQQQGYSIDETMFFFSKMNNKHYVGELDSCDRTTINSAFKSDPKYPPRAFKSPTDELIEVALRELFQEIPSFNEMTSRVSIGKEYLSDAHLSQLRVFTDNAIEQRNQSLKKSDKTVPKIPKDRILDELITLSKSHSFHPFKLFVEHEAWDGIDYLSKLFQTLELSLDFQKYNSFIESSFKKFFMGLTNKIYNPGSRNFVMVLHGTQGVGKSRWVEKLLPVKEAFGEGQIDPENKDSQINHIEKILWHMSELDSVTGRKDAAAIKNYVDSGLVTIRRPYEKFPVTKYSQLSFIASVNTYDFLRDTTGNRRFLVLPIKSLIVDHSINMQQVFAQSKCLLDSGLPYWLTKEDEAIQNEINGNFNLDSLVDIILDHIEQGLDSDWHSVPEIREAIAVKISNPHLRLVSTSELRNKIEMLKFETKTEGKSAKKFNVRIKLNKGMKRMGDL